MRKTRQIFPVLLLAIVVVVCSTRLGRTQENYNWINTGSGNWNNAANWDDPPIGGDSVPFGTFGDTATISAGTALVEAVMPLPGAVFIDGTGMVQVDSGLELETDASGSLFNPNANGRIGTNVQGVLNLRGSGKVTATAFNLGGVFDYDVTAASNFAVAPASATGTATLGGTLNVDFSGTSFTVGQTLNLFDAESVSGSFNAINVTGNAPAANEGFRYAVNRTTTGSTNGVLAQLTAHAALVLNVNRDTGLVSVISPSGNSVDMDGYTLISELGAIAPGSWSTLEGAVSGWDAAPAPTENELGETNPNGSLAVTSPINLGAIYSAPAFTEFGVVPSLEDTLVFNYTNSAEGVVQGFVQYEGQPTFNNLVLTIDPTSGEASLNSDSPFAVELDGYTVESDAGILLTGFDGLTGNGPAGWDKPNPQVTGVSEVNTDGSTTVSNSIAAMNLGTLINPGGMTDEQLLADLSFNFTLDGDSVETRIGQVVIGPLPSGIPGDFNGDDIVNGADFLAWQRGEVSIPPSPADLADWETNYGVGSLASATVNSVPEPSGVALVASALAGCFAVRRRHAS